MPQTSALCSPGINGQHYALLYNHCYVLFSVSPCDSIYGRCQIYPSVPAICCEYLAALIRSNGSKKLHLLFIICLELAFLILFACFQLQGLNVNQLYTRSLIAALCFHAYQQVRLMWLCPSLSSLRKKMHYCFFKHAKWVALPLDGSIFLSQYII